MLTFYIDTLKQFQDFKSRTSRKDYWVFTLISLVLVILLSVLDSLLGTAHAASGMGLLVLLFNLVLIVPSLAIAVRRFHDIGRSGWWVLVSLIPFIGLIVLIVFMLMPGLPDANEYGPAPKDSKI